MKKILILAILLVASTIAFSQSIKKGFAGYAKVTSITGTGPNYTVVINSFNGNNSPQGTAWSLTDMRTDSTVLVKDVLYSGGCDRFVIIARSGTTLTIFDKDAAFGSVLPNAGESVGFSRDTLINGYYIGTTPQFGDGAGGAISGISNAMAAF